MIRSLVSRLVPLVLLGLVLAPLSAAGEDDVGDDAKVFAREQLLARARKAVVQLAAAGERLDTLKSSIAEDIRYLARYEAQDAEEEKLLTHFEATIQERVLLVGRPGTTSEDGEENPGTYGALQEAVLLTNWLKGIEPCDVLVSARDTTPGDENAYRFPPPKPEAKKPDADAAAPPENPDLGTAPPGALPPPPGEPPVPEDGAGKDDASEKGAEDGAEGKDAEEPAPEPTPPVPEPLPAAPPKVKDWARDVVLVGEMGSLRSKRIRPAVCTTVDLLLEVAARKPIYVHPQVGSLQRHVIVTKEVFAYNKPAITVRMLQVKQHLEAMQEDIPVAGLVDENTVGKKKERAKELHERVKELDAHRTDLLDQLDRMALDSDAWRAQAALLSREIEDERARLKAAAEAAAPPPVEEGGEKEGEEGEEAPKEADTPAPDSLQLRLALARESLVGLNLWLFYQTAVRAELRLELTAELRRGAENEATAAEGVHVRFHEELVRIRNERRLGRLRTNERLLERWIADEGSGEAVDESSDSPQLTAYRSVLAVNKAAQEAVLKRRALTARGTAREARESRSAKPAGDSKSAAAADTASEDAEKTSGKRLSQLLLEPENQTWDVKFVDVARTALEDPELEEEFDAALVAAHFATVDERVKALVESLADAPDENVLRAEFAELGAKARAALEPVQSNYLIVTVRGLPKFLKSAEDDFESAMTGIADQRVRNKERLEALLGYRQALKNSGTRSLLIRTHRDLEKGSLGNALADVGIAVDTAGRWTTLQSDPNAWGWVRSVWLRLLAVVAMVCAIIFGVRRLRRGVDGWIQARATSHPELLGTGVSVREEKAEVKRRKEEEAHALEEAKEGVLQKVAAEPEMEEEEQEEEKEEERR